MDKAEHGKRLRTAMAAQGKMRADISLATGVKSRTVTNWTTGHTMPSERERLALRSLLGPYDSTGDPVELAVRGSDLVEWRQDAVMSVYRRNLSEQREGQVG